MGRLKFPSSLTYTACGLLCAATFVPTQAQTAFFAANAHSSLVPWADGLFGLDFTEAKLALNFVEPLAIECTEPDCVPNRVNFSVHLSGAARKGQRDLTGRLDFVPGFDIGGGIAYVARHARQRHDVVFLRATYTTQQRDFIVSDEVTGTTTIGDESQRSFVVTLGYNHGFSHSSVLGFALEGRREIATPGAQLAREFCTPGRSASGIRVPVCSDRYVGPLLNLWTGQARGDANLAVTNLGTTAASARLTLLVSVSADFIETASTATNVAIGPAITLPDYPGAPVALLLFGLSDIFEANTASSVEYSYFQDHFLTRLAFNIPFNVLTGRR